MKLSKFFIFSLGPAQKEGRENLLLGTVLLISAFFIGAVQNVIIKLISDQTPISLTVFTQYFICLLVYLPTLIVHKTLIFKGKNNGLLILRAFAGAGYFFFMFYALKTMPLTDVSLLTNTAPLWVPLICYLVFRQKLSFNLYITIAIGFTGVAFILGPSGNIASSGAFFSIVSSICMATALIVVKQLATSESIHRILIYYFLTCSLLLLPAAATHMGAVTTRTILAMTLNGILMLIHQALLCYGFRFGPASKLSITVYSAVIFSALFDWIIWEHRIGLPIIIGTVLILFSTSRILFPNAFSKIKVRLQADYKKFKTESTEPHSD